MFIFSRQGKLRLQKWYDATAGVRTRQAWFHPDDANLHVQKDKKKITRDLTTVILSRKPKMCNFLEWKDMKIVYKR